MVPPRLKTNLAILVAGDAAGKLVNVFVFGRLGRILEPERYGHLEFVMAAMFVGALIVEAGLGPWAARAVARAEEPASRIFGRVLALRAMILVAVLLVLGALGAVLGETQGWTRAALLLAGGAMLVPKAALCEWLFQGRNEMASVTMTTFLEPLVALAGTILFVREPAHLGRVPFVLAAAIAAVAVAQHALARRRGIRPDLRHGLEAAGGLLRESFPLALSTLAWAARFFSPMIALALFVSGPEAGAFGAAHRLTVSMHAVVWLWFFNLLPSWSALAREPGRLGPAVFQSLVATFILGLLLVAAVAVLATPLVAFLYGAGYADSAKLLRFLVIVPAVAWVSGNFRFGLLAKGALKSELAASLAGAAVAILALATLGSSLSAVRAAAVFCAAETVTLLVAAALWREPKAPASGPPATAAR